jgi:hypothetical protein
VNLCVGFLKPGHLLTLGLRRWPMVVEVLNGNHRRQRHDVADVIDVVMR